VLTIDCFIELILLVCFEKCGRDAGYAAFAFRQATINLALLFYVIHKFVPGFLNTATFANYLLAVHQKHLECIISVV